MNIYRLWQNVTKGYDTYDSIVVAALDEKSARAIHPRQGIWGNDPRAVRRMWRDDDCWAKSPLEVNVEKIGVCDPDRPAGVILGSFNAG